MCVCVCVCERERERERERDKDGQDLMTLVGACHLHLAALSAAPF